MGIEERADRLKKIKFKTIELELQKEVLEFVSQLGYEKTLTSSSNLHFLYRIYQSEMVKDRQSLRKLKKAEDLIMRLSTRHLDVQKRENQRREKTSKVRISSALMISAISASKKTLDLLGSIGITNSAIADRAEGLFGEVEVEHRVEMVKISNLGDELAKKVFGLHPEIFLTPKIAEFALEIETMEDKKR